ncbi:MAG: TolC family protein, partial [Bacteroidales bacterium]|nr:TolC family protein [Bacteroidales bacterium]
YEAIAPVMNLYEVEYVYSQALENLPQISRLEYRVEETKKILATRYGNLSPKLSASANYSTTFSSDDSLSFGRQANDNMEPTLRLSLSFPIVNGGARRTAIKHSKLDVENSLYDLEQEKQDVRYLISEALQKINAYYIEFEAAKYNLDFTIKSFNSNKERYALGLINSTDFIIAQNQLAQARINYESARLNWIKQDMLIKIYMGESVFS